MWIKTVDNSYYNMLTGTQISVREARNGEEFRIYVMNAGGNTPLACLQSGYRSAEDAQEALDQVLSGQELVEIEVPDYEDEDEEGVEDEEGENQFPEDNYGTLSDDDLRTELINRQLSTRGNTDQLLARLRKDDAKRSMEQESVL